MGLRETNQINTIITYLGRIAKALEELAAIQNAIFNIKYKGGR